MRYILDDEKIIVFPFLLKYVGSGREGNVYKYKEKALKINHIERYERTMDSETCLKLQKLNTKRILLPQNILYNSDYEIMGYTTEFISGKQNIYKITKDNLLQELEELQKELNYLIENKILVNDWTYCDNFIYDGMFRFIDPGLYKLDNTMSKKEVRKFDYSVLRDFLFYELLKYGIIKEKCNGMKIIGKKYDDSRKKNNLCSFFEKEIHTDETLEQYIKRIVKK